MKLVRIAVLFVLAVLAAPSSVAAHSGVQSYVYVSVFDDGLEGRVEYPIADLAGVLGIDLPDAQATVDELSPDVIASIVGYSEDHLDMGDDDGPWQLDFDGTVSYLDTESGGYVLVPFDVVEDFEATPREWTVTYDGVIEWNPERDALFLIEDDWQSATFRNEGEHLLGFSIGNETQTVVIESVPSSETLWEIARRGSVSIDRSAIALAGLLAVLFSAAVAPGRRPETQAEGTPPWRSGLVTVAATAGLVIAGQSVTLWAIGLLGADVTSRFAMGAGAVGVLIAAALIRLSGTAAFVATAAVGLCSGVLVGWAFVDQELDRSRPLRSLLAFDVGASATVAFVTLLWLPILLLVGRRSSPRLGLAVAAIATLAGLVWFVEASFGLTFKLRTLELRIADAVTSPLIVGVLTVVVGVAVLVSATSARSTAPSDDSPAHDDAEQGPSERIEA